MKKILSLLLSIIMCITLIGCSNTEQEKSDNNINAEQTKNNDLGLDIDEIGDCTFYIKTGENITSENGAIPYIYLQDENTVMQIGYVAEGFDGSKLSYIYIDGELAQKETLSKDYQGTINLENDTIKFGKHKVEVVQYKDSESKNKEDIEVYKVAQYVVTNDDEKFSKGNKECQQQMKSNIDKEESKSQEDNDSNKTSTVSNDKSNIKSSTSSNKSDTKNKNEEDDSKISCPNCGRKISALNNIEINCPYCGYYHNSDTGENEVYDDNYNDSDSNKGSAMDSEDGVKYQYKDENGNTVKEYENGDTVTEYND